MKHFFCGMVYILLLSTAALAQDSTAVRRDSVPAKSTATSSADDLLAGLADSSEAAPLLPKHMIFTQRAFWGPKGLLRVMNVAPLTSEGRY